MDETVTIPSGKLAYLEERIRKLAGEKSEMQLIMHLINRISALPGLDNLIDSMLQSIVEVVGGDNLQLYYLIDDQLFYADLLGVRKKLESRVLTWTASTPPTPRRGSNATLTSLQRLFSRFDMIQMRRRINCWRCCQNNMCGQMIWRS